jgi:eukaryotic-like serine/threonine-protein kinase
MRCSLCHAENRDDSKFCGNCAAPLGTQAHAGLGPEADSLTKTLETPVRVLKPGALIAGKYRIIKEVGAGGMGVVYKAEDLKLKRCVALKFLPPHLMDSPELKERFLVEAQAAAALSHPNICVIHEVGESEDRPYIAMEYVEGETLRDRVRKGPLKTEEAADIILQVTEGLGEAHGKGIVHRDIKSANIMVTPTGRAKIMDFGLAKLRGGASLTKTQTTLGTIAYMSPEQARGDRLDQRTDIWSLGVVLYELLAGKLPFRGDHDQTIIHAILHREPKPPSKAGTGLPPGLDDIILRALSKKASARYPATKELREDLSAVAEGLKPLRAGGRLRRRLRGLNPAYPLTAALAVALILFGLDVGGIRERFFGRDAAVRPASMKLAVLPFANLTGDPDQEYLSDGLTQEMITLLGRLHPERLGVIARTSVMRYKKTDTPIDQIGRELRVDYILEGSARREGNLLRVSADLIQVRDQTQLWGGMFEREMAGILAMQNDVAREVVKALSLELLPSEQAILEEARPVNPEAHEAYLKGMFHWTKSTPTDLEIAEKYFELALNKDTTYAPAYAGHAWVWVIRSQFGLVSPEEAGPKAKAAALKAIELDEDLAGAHEALAVIRTWTDWDWEVARESWQKTIELNPNVASAQAFFSHFLMIMGHGEEALEHSQRAVVLDPLNPLILSLHAQFLHFNRRYDEAVVVAKEAYRFQPNHPLANSALWSVMHMKGMEREAMESAMSKFKVQYNDSRIDAAFDEGYAQGGYAEAMKHAAEALVSRLPGAYSRPFDIANCYAMAGERDTTIEWLEKGFEVRDPNMPYVGLYPVFDDLRPDPRFQDLLRRMNLPAEALVSVSEKQ